MVELILAAWTSQAIQAAAQLGVADALASGPLSLEDLARRVDADPDALRRLLRALVGRGVFRQDRHGRYALNPLADTLRSDAPQSMAAAAKYYGSPQHREHWSMLVDSIRTGQASIPRLRGKDFFEYLDDEPELAALFNETMTNISGLSEEFVITAYPFSGGSTIVDVGVDTADCSLPSWLLRLAPAVCSTTCRRWWRTRLRCWRKREWPTVSASTAGRSSRRSRPTATSTS